MPSHSSNSKTARIAANGPLLRRALTVFCACLLVVSMMLSPFLLSVSMWGLVFAAFWESTIVCRRNGLAGDFRRAGDWFKTLAWSFKNLFRQPPLTLFLLLLLAPAMSFFWSADEAYWLERTRVRLPFLVLPWAFANLPRLAPRHFRLVLYVLVAALTVISLVVAVNVWLHLDDMIAGIGRGDPIPVPRSHIRFSLILATGIISGAWLWLEGFYWRWRQERWLLAAAVLFLFFFIHLLSVRSGIAGLYAILFFSAGWFVWRSKRWGLGLFVLIVALVTPAIALRAIPSLRMRVQYMQWDWQQYRSNLGNTYSDAERMISLRTGWQLWRENPVLGTGAGDLPAEVRRVVEQRYTHYNDAPKLPHNQFVYILAGTGLLGLLLSLPAFFSPLFVAAYRRFYLFAAFQLLAFISFLVEYTIETSIGVAFYLFYTLWFMKMADEG